MGLSGYSAFDVARTGTLIYAEGDSARTQLTWLDRLGRSQSKIGPIGPFIHLDLSRDERLVLVERYEGGKGDLWMMDAARGLPTPLTAGPDWSFNGFWSPDATQVVYSLGTQRSVDIYRKDVGGAGKQQKLTSFPLGPIAPSDWSLDGRFVVFAPKHPDGSTDLVFLPLMEPELKPVVYRQGSFPLQQGRISPDGRWMAYVSGEAGSLEVFLSPFPNATAKWRVSTAGGIQPKWRRDGKELFFLAPDKTLMAVAIPTTPEQAGSPTPLFRADPLEFFGGQRSDYAPSADGQRFLFNNRVGDTATSVIQVMVGWQP